MLFLSKQLSLKYKNIHEMSWWWIDKKKNGK